MGYKRNQNKACIFSKQKENKVVYIALYVDDFFVFYNDLQAAEELKAQLAKYFMVKDLGLISYILGIKIVQDKENKVIKLNQSHYIMSVLSKFGMSNANLVGTPLQPNVKFNEDEACIDNVPYQQLIGSLMYLCVSTRRDIAYAVSFLSQFNTKYTNEHWSAAKRVLRYLKGTIDMCLTFKGTDLIFEGYVRTTQLRKSFTGFVFKMCNAAVSWGCRK